jgi:hypothetical protein
MSWEISVSIAMSYKLDSQVLIPGRGKRFFCTPEHPDQLWGPHSLLYNEYQQLFPQGYSGRGMKLTTHLHLVVR